MKQLVFETFQLKSKFQIIFNSTEIRLEKSVKLYHQCFLLLQPKPVIKQTPETNEILYSEIITFP